MGTSIEPEDKRLGSWIYFCFSKIVKQSFLFFRINGHIARILLEPDGGLTRQPGNSVEQRRRSFCFNGGRSYVEEN